MKKFLNTIWILALAVAMCSFVEKASSTPEKLVESIVLDFSYQTNLESPQKNTLTDAELGGIPLHNGGVLLRFSHNSMDESVHLLKVEKKFSLYNDNQLAKYCLKHTASFTPLLVSYPSEYYVFTLRKLLI